MYPYVISAFSIMLKQIYLRSLLMLRQFVKNSTEIQFSYDAKTCHVWQSSISVEWPSSSIFTTTIAEYMLPRRCWRQPASALLRARLRGYGTSSSTGLSHDLSRPVQSYISKSRDPYINLSIEHYLLQKSSPDAAILFLYVNRPSIIIGRNQNPWLEVNLALLKAGRTNLSGDSSSNPQTEPPGLGDVDLVRRRSGGGTVFHDEGNVNWTVISPSADFTRDKHAEMVVRALRNLDVARSRVNERHDIVLDQGSSSFGGYWGAEEDTHSTPWQTDNPRSLKVSGSAYKLTRQRALHHGTALLNSPNLNVIPHYLRSPAKGSITGRGVESVSSPVGNILLDNDDFIEEVQSEFRNIYGGPQGAETVSDEWMSIQAVKKGWEELTSPEWTYLQTPQFLLSNNLAEYACGRQSTGPGRAPATVGETTTIILVDTDPLMQIHMNVKNGVFTEVDVDIEGISTEKCDAFKQILFEKRVLHEIVDWSSLFSDAGLDSKEARDLADWVSKMLPANV